MRGQSGKDMVSKNKNNNKKKQKTKTKTDKENNLKNQKY